MHATLLSLVRSAAAIVACLFAFESLPAAAQPETPKAPAPAPAPATMPGSNSVRDFFNWLLPSTTPAPKSPDGTLVDPTKMPEEYRRRLQQMRDEIAEKEGLRRLSTLTDHDKALDWLHNRSAYIVKQIDNKEFDPKAWSMHHWHEDGLFEFYRSFKEAFPTLREQIFYYQKWHQGFLRYEAKRLGWYDEKYDRPADAAPPAPAATAEAGRTTDPEPAFFIPVVPARPRATTPTTPARP